MVRLKQMSSCVNEIWIYLMPMGIGSKEKNLTTPTGNQTGAANHFT
jgi:riboflavin biosynthesis pyrimidine reductase